MIKLKFKKPDMSFLELDSAYQNHFYKQFALTGGLFLLSIIISLLIRKYLYILGCLFIAACYCLYLYYQIYKSLTGNVFVMELTCVEVNKQEKTFFGNKDIGSKTCSMILRSENDINFVQPVAYSSTYKPGDIIRIYAEDGSITQMNSNTYSILNPIFMHVLASS